MPIFLDHTIVPARDKEASARFFARIFGLEYKGPWGHFASVKVNETLSLDFDNRDVVEHHHYAFIVNDEEFDVIFRRVLDEGLAWLLERDPSTLGATQRAVREVVERAARRQGRSCG